MADLNEIVDTLSGLTVMEAAELATLLEDKWGVSAAAPVAVAAAAGCSWFTLHGGGQNTPLGDIGGPRRESGRRNHIDQKIDNAAQIELQP